MRTNLNRSAGLNRIHLQALIIVMPAFPSGAGPRFCPGRNLAILEIKMAMAMLCRNFSITRVETGLPVQEIFSFTMMPDKLMVKFEAR